MLSSLSNMLEKVGEGMAMAVSKAAGDLSLDELEEKVCPTTESTIDRHYRDI